MDTHTHTHTYTHDNYYNPRCAHAHRGLMKALKCKPSAQFAYNYSINVLSKCSNIISHRSSVFEGQCLDLQRSAHRSPKVDIDLRKSTHRPSKVDTSTIDLRHIDLRKSTHRSSKVNTPKAETSHRQFVTEYCPQRRSIVLYPKILYGIISDEVTYIHVRLRVPATTRCPQMCTSYVIYAYLYCFNICASRRGN